jgi:hypothetical protein
MHCSISVKREGISERILWRVKYSTLARPVRASIGSTDLYLRHPQDSVHYAICMDRRVLALAGGSKGLLSWGGGLDWFCSHWRGEGVGKLSASRESLFFNYAQVVVVYSFLGGPHIAIFEGPMVQFLCGSLDTVYWRPTWYNFLCSI